MKSTRRTFMKNGGLFIACSAIVRNKPFYFHLGSRKMKLSFKPYTLQMKHVFTLATSSRTTTPIMITEIEYDGLTGYGEASMPPYLGESHKTVSEFLSKVNLSKFSNPFELEDIMIYIDSLDKGNFAAKASLDIALHDLVGKLMNQPWYNIYGFKKEKTPLTSFTIGIDTEEIVRKKVEEAHPYKVLKLKMGRENDMETLKTVRSMTDVPVCVDVNQGWKDREKALDIINELSTQNVLFVEQPMPKDQIEDIAWLTQNSPLPIIADEAIQRLPDVIKAYNVYSGINIKLMKCTGMREAHKMITLARSLGMKVMLGCMVESSCAVSAAAHLSAAVDYADLDGNLLVDNDPFEGMKISNGKITLNNQPGIGVRKS